MVKTMFSKRLTPFLGVGRWARYPVGRLVSQRDVMMNKRAQRATGKRGNLF